MIESVYTRHNTDDVFNRCVIGGLLHLLNHKVTYEQVWDDNVVERVTVPFAYNFVSSEPNERFIQDNYTFFGRECFSDKIVDGNFEMLPRFVLSYESSQIDSANITNRFVKGTYQEQVDGKVETRVAYMFQIPLTMNFSLEGWVDNYINAFKIEQAIRDVFYKNKTFWVQYRGMKIGCCVGFPESITTGEKTVSYTFSQENQIKMSFNLSVETYQPCFDPTTSMKEDDVIEYVGLDVNCYVGDKMKKKLDFEFLPLNKTTYHVGDVVELKWKARSTTMAACASLLYYTTSDGDRHVISPCDGMRGYHKWVVPGTISKVKQPTICVFDTDDVYKLEDFEMTVTPNDDGLVTTGSFNIINPGKYCGSGYLQLSCDYMDDLGNVVVHDCYVAEVDGDKGIVAVYYHKDSPITLSNMINNKRLKYKKNDYKTSIDIGIMYVVDNSIYDEICNVLII